MNLNYNVTSGNAGNILVLINKDVRGKVGDYGEVVDSIIIDIILTTNIMLRPYQKIKKTRSRT